MLMVDGRVERNGQVVHVLARAIRKLDDLDDLAVASRDFH
jgi:hypothetical protein